MGKWPVELKDRVGTPWSLECDWCDWGILRLNGDGWEVGPDAHTGVLVVSAVTERWKCITMSSSDLLLRGRSSGTIFTLDLYCKTFVLYDE